MIALEFKDYPDTSTPLNAENLNEMQRNLLDLVYPIGRGFIDFTDTDYSDYLGFTWERECIGMVPVGKDPSQTEFNTIGKTGGAKTHTLTIDQMPSHNHSVKGSVAAGPLAEGVAFGNDSTPDFVSNVGMNFVGGGQAHNNLQPYKVVNYWKRVA